MIAAINAETRWGLVRQQILKSDCWLWTGPVNAQGYGQVRVDSRTAMVHRLAYEQTTGPVPDGMVIDHICHDPATCIGGKSCLHRRCLNPAHLAVSTPSENSKRQWPAFKTECVRGHPLSGANLGRQKGGGRYCLTCHRARSADFVERLRRRVANGESPPSVIRAWAIAQGYNVSAKGRITTPIVEAYYAAREMGRAS